MSNTFLILKSIHVVAATLWVGGGFILVVALTLAFRMDDAKSRLTMLQIAGVVGPKVFTPLSFVVLATGIWMTVGWFSFADVWIVIGLVGIVLTTAIGAGFLGPQSQKIAQGIASGDDVAETVKRVFTAARIDTAMLVAIVVIMIVRPG